MGSFWSYNSTRWAKQFNLEIKIDHCVNLKVESKQILHDFSVKLLHFLKKKLIKLNIIYSDQKVIAYYCPKAFKIFTFSVLEITKYFLNTIINIIFIKIIYKLRVNKKSWSWKWLHLSPEMVLSYRESFHCTSNLEKLSYYRTPKYKLTFIQ